MRKSIKTMILAFFVISVVSFMPMSVRAQNEYQLWTNPDARGWKVIDYSVGFLWGTLNLGQLHYEWMLKYIPTNDPQYEYWAIYIYETLNPATNMGKGDGFIRHGTTTIDLTLNTEMIVYALPLASAGTATFGTSVSISAAGPTFASTSSYSIPLVQILPSTDANWGGYTAWNFAMDQVGGEPASHWQSTFFFTALIRTTINSDLKLTISLYTKWLYWWWILPLYYDMTETIPIWLVHFNPPQGPVPI